MQRKLRPTRQALQHWLSGTLLCPILVMAAPPARLESESPAGRPYYLGEIVSRHLAVSVPKAYALESGFLPQPGALDEWLELRSVDWERENLESETRYRIHLTYQVFAGVRTPEQKAIPPQLLRFKGPEALELTVPAWSFIVQPLIPAQQADDTVTIRDERLPQARDLTDLWRRFWLCLAAMLAGASGLAWLRLDAGLRSRPFGRAHRRLSRLGRGEVTPDTIRSAVRLIHRALNETAGQTVFAAEVAPFCESRPAFGNLREDLREFFAVSRRLFFTAPEAPLKTAGALERLAELCRRCAAAERGD